MFKMHDPTEVHLNRRYTHNYLQRGSEGQLRMMASKRRNAKLRAAADNVVAFKRRARPAMLKPMDVLVASPIKRNKHGLKDGIDTAAVIIKTKALARQAKRNFLLGNSKVSTPGVVKYMQSLDGLDPGLEIYDPAFNGRVSPTFSDDTSATDSSPFKPPAHDPLANEIIDGWMRSFEVERDSYESISVFAEVRLKEALAATDEVWSSMRDAPKQPVDDKNPRKVRDEAEALSMHVPPRRPSAVRAALCCDLLKKVSSMFGRYSPLMKTLTAELLSCIYADYHSVLDGAETNARIFYNCSPYFGAVHDLEIQRDELQDELEVYNQGINLRQAIAKCSVGVRTMFNDARRAIRDIIFKVWKQYVTSRIRKMKMLQHRVAFEKWFYLWKTRYRRYRERGYFYDSESDDDGEQNEATVEGLAPIVEGDDDLRRLSSVLATSVDSDNGSYKALLLRTQHNASPARSDTSVESSDSEHGKMGGLANFRRITKAVVNKNVIATNFHAHREKKEFKVIKEVTEANGRLVRHCERRRGHVELTDMACQTDFQTDEPEPRDESDTDKDKDKDKDKKKKKKLVQQDTLGAMITGKKEKPMSLEAGMALIPNLYEQYLTMLANPGPDTIGKHLNVVQFTKSSLVRRFGIKQIANKQFKSFVALLGTKKALSEPRLRVFCRLFGLPTDYHEIEKAKKAGDNFPHTPYDEEFVDFFFKKALVNLVPDIKQVSAIMNSKAREVDQEKILDRLEIVFDEIRRKGGFEFPKLERMIEKMPCTTKKGLTFVNFDDLIELIVPYWTMEGLLKGLTFSKVRSIIRFQQAASRFMRNRRREKAEEKIVAEKWKEYFGDDNANCERFEDFEIFVATKLGFQMHHKTLLRMYEHFELEVNSTTRPRKESVAEIFSQEVWSSGMRLDKEHKEEQE